MIDTVEFCVPVPRGSSLWNLIHDKLQRKDSVMRADRLPYVNLEIIDYGKARLKKMNGHFNLPSSHYKIAAIYYEDKREMKVNVSVPKFYFGNNLAQVIVRPGQADHWRGYHLQDQLAFTRELLQRFFEDFNVKVLRGFGNSSRFRIERIDLCFNRIFNSVDHLEAYYEKLKTVKKRSLKKGSNVRADYMSSIHYVGSGYSFKIYKKGIEFRKNDLKELKKSVDRGNSLVNLETLSEFADRILRYEITIRKQLMNRIYKEKIFRRNCPITNMYLKAIESKKKWFIDTEGKKTYLDTSILTQVKKARYKVQRFVMRTNDKEKESNSTYQETVEECALFSSKLVQYLTDFFYRKVEENTLSSYDETLIVPEDIDKNLKASAMILKRKLSVYSLDELYDMGLIPKSTYYHYKKILNYFKVTGQTLSGYPVSQNNYEQYIMEENINQCESIRYKTEKNVEKIHKSVVDVRKTSLGL